MTIRASKGYKMGGKNGMDACLVTVTDTGKKTKPQLHGLSIIDKNEADASKERRRRIEAWRQ